MKNLIIIAVLALGAISCTDKTSEVTPLYDVTFTGFNDILGVVDNSQGKVSGLQEAPANIPQLNFAMWKKQAKDEYNKTSSTVFSSYQNTIPDTIAVPRIDGEDYYTTFMVTDSPYSSGFTTNSQSVYTYPIYLWSSIINPIKSLNYDVQMEHITGKIVLAYKEGQTLPAEYEGVSIEYSTKYNYIEYYDGQPNSTVDTLIMNKELYSEEFPYPYLTKRPIHYLMPNIITPYRINLYSGIDANHEKIVERYINVDLGEIELKAQHQLTLTIDLDKLCCDACPTDNYFLLSWGNEIIQIDTINLN